MIIQKGNKWLLKSKDGKKTLGTHDDKQGALDQEKAIKISQARKKDKK